MFKTITIAALALILAAGPARAEPSQVILVRHAERATEPKDDPSLSDAGRVRAEQLAQLLASAQVQTIFATPYRRTQETAAPLAARAGLTPRLIGFRPGGGAAAHIDELLTEIRKASGVVLVVGHSNTVAALVAGLSSSQPQPLCESSFSHLFIVNGAAAGTQQPALQLRYGLADAAPMAGCQ